MVRCGLGFGIDWISTVGAGSCAIARTRGARRRRVVHGWYPTGFDRVGYGGIIGTLGSTSVPDRTIGWSCSSEGLHLELGLPARDARHQSADDALADILSALPWRGVDVEGGGMRVVVTLVKSGDVAEFDPAKG